MYKILLIAILSTFLNAQNPKPFATIGNDIYDNLKYIVKLYDAKIDKANEHDIKTYITKVKKLKKNGYELELGNAKISPKEYLVKLRKLSKINDYFLRNIHTICKVSMANNNFTLFTKIIDNGLINIESHKKDILTYYHEHAQELQSSQTIKLLLKQEVKVKEEKLKQKKHHKKKRTKNEEKIRRIREDAKKREKTFEKKLQKELELKKQQIREEQRKELCS